MICALYVLTILTGLLFVSSCLLIMNLHRADHQSEELGNTSVPNPSRLHLQHLFVLSICTSRLPVVTSTSGSNMACPMTTRGRTSDTLFCTPTIPHYGKCRFVADLRLTNRRQLSRGWFLVFIVVCIRWEVIYPSCRTNIHRFSWDDGFLPSALASLATPFSYCAPTSLLSAPSAAHGSSRLL